MTQEELKKKFEKYGEISSCVIKKTEIQPSMAQKISEKGYKQTNYGFINFSDKEYAKRAIQEAKYNPEIQALYEKVYLNYLITKDQLAPF